VPRNKDLASRVPDLCPNGGCPRPHIKSHSHDWRHCNGEWHETVTFECGARVAWVPNYSKQFTEEVCPFSREGIEKTHRSDLIQQLTDYYVCLGYKEWPTDLLALMVKTKNECRAKIEKRAELKERREDANKIYSGFATFAKGNP
jgi:hypothetical protein